MELRGKLDEAKTKVSQLSSQCAETERQLEYKTEEVTALLDKINQLQGELFCFMLYDMYIE